MTDNQKWLLGATGTIIVQLIILAVAWGKLTSTVDDVKQDIMELKQSCISKDVYQTDMKWIDAITNQYYQELKKK